MTYSALIFLLATLSAFYFEAYYRSFIRFLYQYFTAGVISFVGKRLHFFSLKFALAFGVFSIFVATTLFERNTFQVLTKILFTIVLFFLATTMISYFSSQLRIVECTACDDGKVRLHFNGINYDLIFLTSLLVATLPLLLTTIRKQLKSNKKASL